MGQFALVLFGALGLAGDLNHAEEVAIGIFQHDKVIIRFIPPGIASRPILVCRPTSPSCCLCRDRSALYSVCLSIFPELGPKTRWALFPQEHEKPPSHPSQALWERSGALSARMPRFCRIHNNEQRSNRFSFIPISIPQTYPLPKRAFY